MAPYQIPRAKTIFRDVMQNSLGFVRKAFTVILIASAVIWILQNFTPTLAMTSDSRESMLACLGRFLSPLFAPLGFDDWRAVSAVLTGLSAKESVAGTFSILAQTTAGGSVPRLLCDVFTPASSCSFLVFCLLYAPCIASLTAIRKTCGKWRYARLYCIISDGSCVGDEHCGVSDRKDRVWNVVKYPVMQVIRVAGYC